MSVVCVSAHQLMYRRDDVGELRLGDAAVAVHVVELEGKLELVVRSSSEELGQAD